MNIPFRVAFTVACILVGLVFPYAFILAAIVAFSIIADLRDADAEPPATDGKFVPPPEWREHYRWVTESPAEEAFLDAMIEAHGLEPTGRRVLEGDLKLSLQVELPPYRLDFLVDSKLIVEIDGAAWHSSPEAIERDADRDAHFTSRGYRVLRIPAKVPLYAPLEAVRLVAEARAQMAGAEANPVPQGKPMMRQSIMAAARSAVPPAPSGTPARTWAELLAEHAPEPPVGLTGAAGHEVADTGRTSRDETATSAPVPPLKRRSGSLLGAMIAAGRRQAEGRAAGGVDPWLIAETHCLEYVEEDRDYIMSLHKMHIISKTHKADSSN